MGEHTLNVFENSLGLQTQRAARCVPPVSKELTSTHRHLKCLWVLVLQKHCWSLGRQNRTKQWNLPAESVTSSYQPMSVTVETWDIRNTVLCYQASGMSGYTPQFVWEIRISNASQDKGDHFLNPLNAELNPITHLLALLGAHHILHISRIRVKIFGTYICWINIWNAILEVSGAVRQL